MKFIEEVDPNRPWRSRAECCGRTRSRSELRVVPPHGQAFFRRLEAKRPGTLAQVGIANPEPPILCGGCFQKLYKIHRIDGQRVRILTFEDAYRIVWHGPLPAVHRERGTRWEQRQHGHRNFPHLPEAAQARAEANLPDLES